MSARDLDAEVAFLTRALKAPTLREAVPRLAERLNRVPELHYLRFLEMLGFPIEERP